MRNMDDSLETSHAVRTSVPRRADKVLVAVFLSVISLPALTLWMTDSGAVIERTEKRVATTFPDVQYRPGRWFPKKQSLVSFPQGFEAWFNDHLGLRRQFIQVYNLARVTGLTSSQFVTPALRGPTQDLVIVGRDGWLFATADRSVDNYRCTDPFTQEALDTWSAVFRERRDWLAQRGIHYVVAVAPDKQTIYGEFLPRSINRVGNVSRLDQLIEHFRHDGIDMVDLRPALLAASQQHRVYYQQDTHWNQVGALVGCERIVRHLQPRFPELRSRTIDEFRITTRMSDEGDLGRVVDLPLNSHEEVLELAAKQTSKASLAIYEVDVDGSVVRVGGNPSGELEKAVVLGDSFNRWMAPFFTEHCRYVRHFYHAKIEFPLERIEQERPQVVVQMFVERKLMLDAPENAPEMRDGGLIATRGQPVR